MNLSPHTDDLALLDELRTLWTHLDPPPADLAERMITAVLGADAVDLDFELLGLIAHETQLAGTRSGAAAARDTTSKLEFHGDATELVLLIGPERGGRRRIDGWVLPLADLIIRLEVDDRPAEEVRCVDGRFTFGPLAPGLAKLVVTPAEGALSPFQTPVFEI